MRRPPPRMERMPAGDELFFPSPSYCCTNRDAGSTFTPGPMVEEIATRLMKVPLAPAGLAFCTASANALMFCTSLSAANEALPIPAWTMPAFSTLNSTEPPLAPCTAPVTSMVTVPTFGFGIMPRGPRTLPSRPTRGMRSGVAMQRSKSILPPCTFSTRSSAPTTSAPAAFASSALAPRANTATRTLRPDLVGMARVDAEIHRDLDGLVELGLRALLDHLHRLFERIELGAIDALADGGGA